MMKKIKMTTILIPAITLSIYGCGEKTAEKYLEMQVPHYERECRNGDVRYCEVLADFYAHGTAGLPKDLKKARLLYEKACNKKDRQNTACRKIDPGDILYQLKEGKEQY